MKVIHNAQTNETLEISLTDEDLVQLEEKKAREKSAQEALEEAELQLKIKRQAAVAKLEALGLDEDDLKALGL